jgi:hypothetical protein
LLIFFLFFLFFGWGGNYWDGERRGREVGVYGGWELGIDGKE